MRPLVFLLLFLYSASSGALADEEIDNSDLWLKLSAVCQNAGYKFATKVGYGNEFDRSLLDDDSAAIDTALSALVEAGELIEMKVTLKCTDQLNKENGTAKLKAFVHELSDTHGAFVALEMVDMGIRSLHRNLPADSPMPLNLRLPPGKMESFLIILATEHLITGEKEQFYAILKNLKEEVVKTHSRYRKIRPFICGTGLQEAAEFLSDENIAKLRAEGDAELADHLKSRQKEFFEKYNPSPEREAKINAYQMRLIQLERAIELIQAVANDTE